MTPRPPYLPDAVIGLVPHLLEVAHQCGAHGATGAAGAQAAACRHGEGGHQLAEHVQLELRRRQVADAHRRRPLVAREPVELELGQAALAPDAVHDLEVARVAGDGASQPPGPRRRFVVVARQQEALHGERRVAEPGVPVVPVADASDLLGQRCGRGRAHRSGGRVGEGLQRDQRADDVVAPSPRVGAARRPFVPPPPGAGECPQAVDRVGRIVRAVVAGERERVTVALAHLEGGAGRLFLTPQRDRAVEPERVGAGDHAEPVTGRLDPRHQRPVVEPHDQLHLHGDRAPPALDHPVDRRMGVLRCHEVDHGHRAVGRLVDRLEHERVVLVPSGGRHVVARGGDRPTTVPGCAEQCGERGRRVDPRCAEPVDGAAALDQCDGVRVADERVVLDASRHVSPPSREVSLRRRDG